MKLRLSILDVSKTVFLSRKERAQKLEIEKWIKFFKESERLYWRLTDPCAELPDTLPGLDNIIVKSS